MLAKSVIIHCIIIFCRQMMLKRRLIFMQQHRKAFAHPVSEFEVIIADYCKEDYDDNYQGHQGH